MNPISESSSVNSSNQCSSCCTRLKNKWNMLQVNITKVWILASGVAAVYSGLTSNWTLLSLAVANGLTDSANLFFLQDNLTKGTIDQTVQQVGTECIGVDQVNKDLKNDIIKLQKQHEEDEKFLAESRQQVGKVESEIAESLKKTELLINELKAIYAEKKGLVEAADRTNGIFQQIVAETNGELSEIAKNIKIMSGIVDQLALAAERFHKENQNKMLELDKQGSQLKDSLKALPEMSSIIANEEAHIKVIDDADKNAPELLNQIREQRQLLAEEKKDQEIILEKTTKQTAELREIVVEMEMEQEKEVQV